MINSIDMDFNNLINFIKERDLEQMIKAIKQNFYYYRNKNADQFKCIVDYYNKYKLWGEIDLENENYELIKTNAEVLVNHHQDFEQLYHNLGDYRSKMILVNVLYYWLMLDDKRIAKMKDTFYSQYFDLDLIKCDENEVIVDVGAYIGDTLVDYIKTFGNKCYKKIFCYEIVPANIKYIKKNIDIFDLKNVVIKEKGVADKKGSLFIENDECSSIKKLTDSGQLEVKTISIDEDINGKITFVKMDIEGGELLALKGLQKNINLNQLLAFIITMIIYGKYLK